MMILGMIDMRQQIKAHSNGHSMSWKSPGFHQNPLKDLKRFPLHISRFLFTPSLLFTYILCTMQHMLGPIMTMRIILSHVKTRGIAGGRSVGVAFFQPPSNIIQTHSNVIQNLKPQKISVKKVCLLFPTEILLNVLAQNWHGWMRVPMWNWVPMWEELSVGANRSFLHPPLFQRRPCHEHEYY